MAIGKRKRFEILNRDGFTCQYCGRRPPVVILHVDHRISVRDGGRDHDSNLVAACQDCNLGKAAKSVFLTISIGHDADLERRTMAAVEDAYYRGINQYLLYQDSAGQQELLEEAAAARDPLTWGEIPPGWFSNTANLTGL